MMLIIMITVIQGIDNNVYNNDTGNSNNNRCFTIRLTIFRFEEGGKFDHDRTVYGSQ